MPGGRSPTRTLLVAFALSVAFAATVGACSTSESPARDAGAVDAGATSALHPADDGGIACRDYPDVGFRRFPFLSSPVVTGLPLCTPSCHPHLGAAGVSQAPSDQDLPSGPCDDEGAACLSGLAAQSCGVCRYTGGPGSGYVCACRAHRWQCANESPGASACDIPRCLLVDPGVECQDFKRTATEVCLCGVCHKLCGADAECDGGTCQLGEICSAPERCDGPDECVGTCTGFCK